MKAQRIKIVLTLFLSIFAFNVISAQEEVKGMKQRLEINVDELGDAEINLIMKLNASQWDIFKKTIGNNPAYLKREIIKGMPAFYLTDFKYEEDPMERTYKMSMKGLGAVEVNENGKWESNLEMKDPEIIQLNNQQFRLNLNMLTNGVFIEQVQLINLPKNARKAKIETDSFGYAVLTYESGTGTGKMLAKGAGLILILSGILLGIFNRKVKGKENEIPT